LCRDSSYLRQLIFSGGDLSQCFHFAQAVAPWSGWRAETPKKAVLFGSIGSKAVGLG
jgi:hypothetical protein